MRRADGGISPLRAKACRLLSAATRVLFLAAHKRPARSYAKLPATSVSTKAAGDAGSAALAVTNSFPAMAIDIHTRKPKLANITGGLTGPAIKPIAIKLVWEAARAVKIPIIGMGGIQNADDAIEFLMAGASAVAVGTANFYEPQTPLQVIAGIRDFMGRKGIEDVREMVGSVQVG